jgi:hypothetical protein
MKLFQFCGALAVALSMTSLADAGLLGLSKGGCGAEKGCGCAPTCQPACCKPVIVKPCCPNVYTYQRKCSDIKPPCCDRGCAPAACAPACAAPAACAPAARHCGPAAAPACAAPAACAPAAAPACAAPAACAPAAAPACAAPAACAPAATACTPANACCPTKKSGGLLSNLFGKSNKGCNTCAPTCGAPAPTCAAPAQTRCCTADPCEIACLIYESQTACYAKDRRKAIDKLGRKFDCVCNPEIMTAFIVALNDCDERVRKEAADEIGDQIRKHCCCTPEVVAALTCALGDCDKGVVKQAKEALELCGYEVVEGNCNPCGAHACGANGCAPAAPAPMNGAAPAPVPPEGQARKSSLSQLLGLLD